MEKVRLDDICVKQSSKLAQKDLENMDGSYPIFGASGLIKKINTYDQKAEYVAVVKDGAGVGRTMLLPAYSSVIGTLQYLIPNDNVNAKYLYYAVKSRHLEKYSTGSAIPHIYFKDYKSEPIILFDRIAQKKIALVLERVEKIIEKHKQQLEMLDTLIKARFVEMFYDKGYPVLKWNDVFNTTTGKLDSNAAVDGGTYPFFTCSKEVLRIDDYAFEEEALLLAGNNAAGKYDVKYYSGKFNAYQRTYVLTLKENWSHRLFQYQLEDKLAYLQQQSLGGLTKYLTLKILGELEFIIPPKKQQDKFDLFIKQVDKSKSAIQKSLEKTQTLFDSLMQKYFG